MGCGVGCGVGSGVGADVGQAPFIPISNKSPHEPPAAMQLPLLTFCAHHEQSV